MKPPRGERIAEQLPRDQNGDDDGDEHRGGELQISRGLERDERHGQRGADDRCRKRPHADHGVNMRIERQAGPYGADAGGEQVTADGAQQQGGEEQAAAKAAAERGDGRHRLEQQHHRHFADRPLDDAGKMQRAVA